MFCALLALRLRGEDSGCAAAWGTCKSRDPARTCSDLAGALDDGAASREEEEEAAAAHAAAPPLADASIVVLLAMDEVAENAECVVLWGAADTDGKVKSCGALDEPRLWLPPAPTVVPVVVDVASGGPCPSCSRAMLGGRARSACCAAALLARSACDTNTRRVQRRRGAASTGSVLRLPLLLPMLGLPNAGDAKFGVAIAIPPARARA